MMKLLRVSIAVVAFVLAQPVLAQGGPPNGKGPIGRLQSAVDELASQIGTIGDLTARIEALEGDAHAAPDPDVAWRTYCRRTIATVLAGDLALPNRLRKVEFVQLVSFIPNDLETPEIGMVDIDAVSITGGILLKNDLVVFFGPFPGMDQEAAYRQAGTRIDVTFLDGDVLTLYSSKDGSLLHGTNVLRSDDLLDVTVFDSHFVEIDGVEATCGDEVVLPL